jgi:uncharacterized protein (DUF1800 family)
VTTPATPTATSPQLAAYPTGPTPALPSRPTERQAARLLTQATFGPTDASIKAVMDAGYTGWINAQMAMPLPAKTHTQYLHDRNIAQKIYDSTDFYETWWRQAISEPDQLRQRVTFALSQIFVISLNDPNLDTIGSASFYDMLQRNSFGNFRRLLEDVTHHPMMGRYLTYLANQKEDSNGTRKPDENYAREVMQLMTIGLHELNLDGTPKLSGGQPVPTYTSNDIQGLAKVFTGLSWQVTNPNTSSFFSTYVGDGRHSLPMIYYPTFHSTSEKAFLGVTIPANTTIDVGADMKVALDTLFNHPNVGPFISQRLIQQLVTSNPSPAYVARVATVFNNNGQNVRGDMGAVIRAILTDPEAYDERMSTVDSYGKLREPVIRITNWARAFNATSQTGMYLMPNTSSNTSLGQTPLSSPSVFNFWRPGFVPPDSTEAGKRRLTAPEFQAVDEVSVAAWVNNIMSYIDAGIGSTPPNGQGRDIRPDYSAELALAGDPAALVARMNKLLFAGQMSATLASRINAAVTAITLPAANADAARLNRVKTAIFLSMISPEYLAQR